MFLIAEVMVIFIENFWAQYLAEEIRLVDFHPVSGNNITDLRVIDIILMKIKRRKVKARSLLPPTITGIAFL